MEHTPDAADSIEQVAKRPQQLDSFEPEMWLDREWVGDPPFWSYPWIILRGVPAMRYQDERVVAVEAELRSNVLPRWAVAAFLGCGATDGDLVQFESQAPILADGIGGRYLFADDLGVWIGVDVARGPEDYVGYIQVGHAW